MGLIKERCDENNGVRKATWQQILWPKSLKWAVSRPGNVACKKKQKQKQISWQVFSWSSILGEIEIIFFIWPNVLLIILVSDHFKSFFIIFFYVLWSLFHSCNFFHLHLILITWFLDVLNHCTIWFQLNSLHLKSASIKCKFNLPQMSVGIYYNVVGYVHNSKFIL